MSSASSNDAFLRDLHGTDDAEHSPINDSLRPVRLKNPLHSQLGCFRRLAAIFVIITVVCLPLGIQGVSKSEPSGMAIASCVIGMICGSAAAVCAIVMACLGYYRKRYDRDLVEFEQGGALVHWTYSSAEWERFVDMEANEAGQIALWTTGIFGVVALLIGSLAGCNGAEIAGSALVTTMLVTVGGALFGLACGAIVQAVAVRRCNRLRREVGEAFIGPRGLYFAGDYRLWSMLGQSLSGVALRGERNPQVLSFRFRMQTSRGSTYHEVNVPVPAGQEELAQALASRMESL